LITALGGFNLWSLVLTALPMTVVAVVAGFWPLRGKLSFRSQRFLSAQSAAKPSPLPFIKELTPILIVIMLGIAIGAGLSRLDVFGQIAKEIGLIIALVLAILLVLQTNGISMATRRKILFNRKLGCMVYMVASILIFKGILEDSQAVDAVCSELFMIL
jgi:hypothetical protein